MDLTRADGAAASLSDQGSCRMRTTFTNQRISSCTVVISPSKQPDLEEFHPLQHSQWRLVHCKTKAEQPELLCHAVSTPAARQLQYRMQIQLYSNTHLCVASACCMARSCSCSTWACAASKTSGEYVGPKTAAFVSRAALIA